MIHSKTRIALEPAAPIDLFIFNWEGTLVDSIEVSLVEKIFLALDLKAPAEHIIKEAISKGLQNAIETLNVPVDKASKFLELYNLESTRTYTPKPFPGVCKALESLTSNAKILILITNQERGVIHDHLRVLGFEKYFAEVYTIANASNNVKNSNSNIIEEISKQFGVSKDAMILISDNLFHMQLANDEGVRAIACSYGHETAQKLLETKPAYICHHPDRLCSFLQFKDLSIEIIKEKTSQIDYYDFEYVRLSEKEREVLLEDIYTVYSRVLLGRTKESLLKFLPLDIDVHVICAYDGFGHVKAFNIISRYQIIYPPESKSEADRYSTFECYVCIMPEFAGREFMRKSLYYCVRTYHLKFPNENLILFEKALNYMSFKIAASLVEEKYSFPYGDEGNVEVNKFVDYLKERFGYKSAHPGERYVLNTMSRLVKRTYPSATDRMGNYYVEKTKNLPGYSLLFIIFFKLLPDNSVGLAPTEAEWLNPRTKRVLRPRL